MLTLSIPRLSFIQFGYDQFNKGNCAAFGGNCLPVHNDNDLGFQLLITTSTVAETRAVINAPTNDFQLVLLKGGTTDITQFTANTLRNFTLSSNLYFIKNVISPTQILLTWNNPIMDFELFIPCGDTFQLGFVSILSNFKIRYPSNMLQRDCNDCYSSVLEYSCEENSYGFNYCGAMSVNRVRVPIYVQKPQFVDEENVYLKSNGAFKITKSVTKEQFAGLTDYLDRTTHEKIKVALSHDKCLIESAIYSGGISKEGGYDIGWQEIPGHSSIAPATFKVNATPYNVRNNNCAECQSFGTTLALVDDYMPGILDVNLNYQIDVTANDTLFCNAVFSIVYINHAFLISAMIDTIGKIYVTTQSSFTRPSLYPITNPPIKIATYQVTCGSQVMTADLYASFFI